MNLYAVILAAGRGKRMNSLKPKVLHEVFGKSIIQNTIDAIKTLQPEKLVVVVGKEAQEVKEQIKDKTVSFVLQGKPLGTGNALAEAKNKFKDLRGGTVIVINGDSPLITSRTLKGFLKKHKNAKNDISLLSFMDYSLSGYGRILRDTKRQVKGIIEDRHATADEKKSFRELNCGIYAIEPVIMEYLSQLKKHRTSGEYYLTDIVGIASKNNKKISTYDCPPEEALGINNREELYRALNILNKRSITKWMRKGVTFIDPSTSIVHPSVTIGKDTIIYPNTYLEGNTSIGANCMIYPGVRICHSTIEQKVSIKDNTLIENSTVKSGSTIGPFAHLRPLSRVGRNVKIGNFVEIKKSDIGDRTRASHLSYLGDAVIGKDVNIGAGTITCNYDGATKQPTIIKSKAFIGSASQLIAPVTIGKSAYIAAGSTVVRDVPSGSLAISRAGQKNIKNWQVKGKPKVKKRK